MARILIFAALMSAAWFGQADPSCADDCDPVPPNPVPVVFLDDPDDPATCTPVSAGAIRTSRVCKVNKDELGTPVSCVCKQVTDKFKWCRPTNEGCTGDGVANCRWGWGGDVP